MRFLLRRSGIEPRKTGATATVFVGQHTITLQDVTIKISDDVTIKQATGVDMRLGDYWSSSMNLDQQGKVIFTKLVPTPEPTTGTLCLLALAALCTRRHRRK